MAIQIGHAVEALAPHVGSPFGVHYVGAFVNFLNFFNPGFLWPGYFTAAAVALFVGVAELLVRYKDNPSLALYTAPAGGYLAISAIFGIVAFWLSYVLDIIPSSRPILGDSDVTVVKCGLFVGFGAVFILRTVPLKFGSGSKASAPATAGKGDAEAASTSAGSEAAAGKAGKSDSGAATIVDSLLASFDQAINRAVAVKKDKRVRKMMSNISFEKSKGFISAYCLSLVVENVEMAERLGQMVADIEKIRYLDGRPQSAEADAERAFLLGNALINIFGYDVASKVIIGFKDRLRLESGLVSNPFEDQAKARDKAAIEAEVAEGAKAAAAAALGSEAKAAGAGAAGTQVGADTMAAKPHSLPDTVVAAESAHGEGMVMSGKSTNGG